MATSVIDPASAIEALRSLAGVDVDGLDRTALDDLVVTARRVRGFCERLDVLIARRARLLAEDGRSECAEDVLGDHGRRAHRDARAVAARERACDAMPCFETALATGAVSGAHLDAMAAATHALDDVARAEFHSHAPALHRYAEDHTVEEFQRECRDLARAVARDEGESRLADQRRQRRVRRWVDRITGMHHLHAELDPVAAAAVDAALDAATAARRCEERADQDGSDTISWDRACADALVELVTGARSVDVRVPEVCVHVDWRTLLDGLHEQSLCETSDGTHLPPSTVRRLCCAAHIVPVVLDGAGEVLDVGRSRRLATRAQRRALRSMYATCAHPGCPVPFDRTEVHHVRPWEDGGSSDLDCLLPLCLPHHHLVHEGGWRLTLGPGRRLTLVRPDGEVVFDGPTMNRSPGHRRPAA